MHSSLHTILSVSLATMGLALLVSACSDSRPAHRTTRHIAPRDSTAPYDGIDISSHQGNIDWEKVGNDRNIRFVYIKATEGATYRSSHYQANLKGAQSQNILVGSYHYLTTTSSIQAQFDNFVREASPDEQDLIPMIDVEERGDWSRAQLIDSVSHFADLLEELYGVKPMIYSPLDFYNKNLAPQMNKYPLYVGRYSNSRPAINWAGKFTVWQFTPNGIIPGIDSYVDLCHYHNEGWLDEIAL